MAFHTGAHPTGAHTGNETPRHARAPGVHHIARAAKKGTRKTPGGRRKGKRRRSRP